MLGLSFESPINHKGAGPSKVRLLSFGASNKLEWSTITTAPAIPFSTRCFIPGAVGSRISSRTVRFFSFSYQGRDIMSMMQKLVLCPKCKAPMLTKLDFYSCKNCHLCISLQEAQKRIKLTKEDRNFLEKTNVRWD
jgi:hypothetical protein